MILQKIYQAAPLIILVPLTPEELKAFLEYKKSKIDSLSKLESKRLDELINSRDIVFKYALPASIIDGVAGSLATLLTNNIWILLPVSLFVILVYLLANNLDTKKTMERWIITSLTDAALDDVREQEHELLKEAKK